MAGENSLELYVCRPLWVRTGFGLVVDEYLAIRPGFCYVQAILWQKMVIKK
jgi:hypothetical protein